ncbi:WXG100 family type VII secretion target [Nocardioides sp. SYSU D00065]|uniref:WXG100 family type VII secretion target n=1 Tax=Nocardioides sp. SYSU D00065 TaxID=2817378 RepID=UPI001B345238|nr:WXG100 family type VII secretion target [Nocardioides sp. SYSU D00065]
MILSGTIDLDPAAHATSTAVLRERLDALDARRHATDRRVEAVLACWHGSAADAFRERWAEWRLAACGVVEDLAAAAEALDLARRDTTAADDRRSEAAHRVSGRLG